MSGASGTWDKDPTLWESALGWVDRGYNATLGNITGPIGLSIPEISITGIDRSEINAKIKAEIDAKNVLKMAVVFGVILSATVFVVGKMKG